MHDRLLAGLDSILLTLMSIEAMAPACHAQRFKAARFRVASRPVLFPSPTNSPTQGC